MTVITSPFNPTRVRARSRIGVYLRDAPVVAVVIIALLPIVAIFAPWIAPHDPLQPLPGAKINVGPAWKTGDWSAVLGTDFQGRDILSRVIYGTRISVLIG